MVYLGRYILYDHQGQKIYKENQNENAVEGKLKGLCDLQINEPFAGQTLASMKALDVDPSKVNVNGGAIAVGHPPAASGARITAHLAHELR